MSLKWEEKGSRFLPRPSGGRKERPRGDASAKKTGGGRKNIFSLFSLETEFGEKKEKRRGEKESS